MSSKVNLHHRDWAASSQVIHHLAFYPHPNTGCMKAITSKAGQLSSQICIHWHKHASKYSSTSCYLEICLKQVWAVNIRFLKHSTASLTSTPLEVHSWSSVGGFMWKHRSQRGQIFQIFFSWSFVSLKTDDKALSIQGKIPKQAIHKDVIKGQFWQKKKDSQ